METIKKSLLTYGLDNKEITVFIHLLSNKNGTSYSIAKSLKLPQSTVHNKLETLKEKNLINSAHINNVRYYNVQELNSFKQNLVDKLAAIKEALPAMEKLTNQSQRSAPKVRFYTDKKNTKLVWEEMLKEYKTSKPMMMYGTSHGDLFKVLPRFLPKWVEKRRALPHGVSLIYPESQRGNIGWEPNSEQNEFTKYIPDEFMNASEITTYGDKTVIFYFDEHEPETIVIESKKITQMFEKHLQFMWQHAKK